MFGTPVTAYIQYCILKMCPPPLVIFGPLSVNSWQRVCLDQMKISPQQSQANVDKGSEISIGLWKIWRVTSYWVKLYKRYVGKYHEYENIKTADCMKTRACRRKLMADLKSATKSCTESVKKTHATENEKKLFPCGIFSDSRDPIFNARDPNRVPETP